MSAPLTLGFVTPRHGRDVVGGAEAVMAEAAHGLAERGHPVEILTTCARDHETWANAHEPGVSHDGELLVRRFRCVTDTPGRDRAHLGDRILRGEAVSLADQQRWVNDSLRVPDLWHHVLDNAHTYRALVFAPYLFWTTYAVSQIDPSRSIVMPCLHDEPMARLEIFAPVLERSRGLWFLTEPEADLARSLRRLPARHEVVGAGIGIHDRHDPKRFVTEFGIDRPFLYYAGRREWGKGWLDLLAAFEQVAPGHPDNVVLVTSGAGDVDVPPSLRGRVVDVGFLSDTQRDNAMAAALAYVQPSALESFSRTVLEAWVAGTPVIANGGSAVVRHHVERSGAGLLYQNDAELVEAMRFALDEPVVVSNLARSGRRYVEDGFAWADVLDRMERTLTDWLPVPTGTEPDLTSHRGAGTGASR